MIFRSKRDLTLAGGIVVVASIVVCGAALAFKKPDGSQLSVDPISVNATIIQNFSRFGGGNDRFGGLRFLGGLSLTSPHPAFGGFSGLEISADGKAFFAVSDAGAWLKGRLAYRNDRLSGVTDARMGAISALAGKKLRLARDQDAEAVRLYEGDLEKGVVLIGFEGNQRIGFFDLVGGDLKAPRHYLRPPIRLSRNKGIEAVTAIQTGPFKGAVVAFAERSIDRNGHHRGWLWQKQTTRSRTSTPAARGAHGAPQAISLTNIRGFDITDATSDSDGDLYILERRFRWSEGVKMRVRRIKSRDMRPGAVLSGETMIEADFSFEIDNMEGIAVHRDQRNRIILTLISDNNFNSFLQRNLILQFEVVRHNEKPRS